MNTYGLFSINNETFNLNWHSTNYYPKEARNVLVTLLKLHNLTLNILGYCGALSPKIPIISGCVRVLSGVAICLGTLGIGDRYASQGLIIGYWYDEALLTGMAQIIRGILTVALATIPYGWALNASLDALGTFHNLSHMVQGSTRKGFGLPPHSEPSYPLPLNVICLA